MQSKPIDNLYKIYECTNCGHQKRIMCNHDQLPEIWEVCTNTVFERFPGQCSLFAKEGPLDKMKTTHKRKYKRAAITEFNRHLLE